MAEPAIRDFPRLPRVDPAWRPPAEAAPPYEFKDALETNEREAQAALLRTEAGLRQAESAREAGRRGAEAARKAATRIAELEARLQLNDR